MWIEELTPERLEEFFHHYHQALQVLHNESSFPQGIAKPEKNQLVIAARLTLLGLASNNDQASKPAQFFAKPGQAEWGC